MLRRSVLALGVVAVLSACDDAPTSPSRAVGDTWRLVSLQAAGSPAPIVVSDPSRYQVTFEENGTMPVRSDCNSCGGSYSISGSSLTVTQLACTRAFCGDGSLDARFTAALQQAQTIAFDDEELTIQGTAGILRFRN